MHRVTAISDLHNLAAVEPFLSYLYSEPPDQLYLVGDRTIDPDFSSTDGRNLLREAKNERADGISAEEAEEAVWTGPYGRIVAGQWIQSVRKTAAMHERFEYDVKTGRIRQAIDTGGNNYDKYRRAKRARSIVPYEGDLERRVEDSDAFRTIRSVEWYRHGPSMALLIPFVEDKSREELKGFFTAVRDVLHQITELPLQTVIYSHQNADPSLRKEKNNRWMHGIYKMVNEYFEYQTRLLHTFGHWHGTIDPYWYEGALQISIGYDPHRMLQRFMTLDFDDPERPATLGDIDLTRQTVRMHVT